MHITPGTPGAEIVDAPLSVDRLLTKVTEPRVGGVALFVGVVRNTDDGQDVVSLDYRPASSADVELRTCAERAAEEHDVLSVAVEHRVGHLDVGDPRHRGHRSQRCTADLRWPPAPS